MHHYLELMDEPNTLSGRFLALWKQIAEHFKDYPDTVMFEPLNEPQGALTSALWNDLLNKAIVIIRQSNPRRTIVIDPAKYANVEFIDKLEIPKEDRNIIISFHYYSPFQFTHQNAAWIPKSKPWLGTTWTETKEQKKAINDAFDKAAAWGKKNNRPINLGEFGAYKDADKDSRALWTAFVANVAVKRGFSFDYWEFCHENFGAYDQQTNQWKDYLLKALIPPKK